MNHFFDMQYKDSKSQKDAYQQFREPCGSACRKKTDLLRN